MHTVLLAVLGGSTVLAAAAADGQAQSETRPPVAMTMLHDTESVLGKRLAGASGENAGRIIDVLADETGQVQAAIVEYGGFLGIGSRKIAVSWSDLRFRPESDPDAVAVDIPRERLARAPSVKAGEPVIAISSRQPAWHRAAHN